MGWWDTYVRPRTVFPVQTPVAVPLVKAAPSQDTFEVAKTVAAAVAGASAGMAQLLVGCAPTADTGSECAESKRGTLRKLRKIENTGDTYVRGVINGDADHYGTDIHYCNDRANEAAAESCTASDAEDDFASCDDQAKGEAAFAKCAEEVSEYGTWFSLAPGQSVEINPEGMDIIEYTRSVGAVFHLKENTDKNYWDHWDFEWPTYCPWDNVEKTIEECLDDDYVVISCGK